MRISSLSVSKSFILLFYKMEQLANLNLAIKNVLSIMEYAKFENEWLAKMADQYCKDLIVAKIIISEIIQLFNK